MNKDNFEKELRAKLSKLPAEESQKILDYYDELYHEKREAGESEREIIKSFGTPSEVAKKLASGLSVLDDYVGDEEGVISDACERDDYASESLYTRGRRKLKTTAKGVGSGIKRIFTNKTFWIIYCSLFFITIPLTIAAVSVVFSLSVAALSVVLVLFIVMFVFGIVGAVFVIAGPIYAVFGIIIAFSNVNAGLAQIGGGLAIFAIGFAFLKSFELLNWLRIKIFVKKEERAKKPSKRFIPRLVSIIAVLVFIAGGVLFTIGFGSAGWDYNALNAEATVEFTRDGTETIKELEIDVTTRNIEVIKSEGGWRVETHNIKDCEIVVEVENSVLKIIDKCDVHKFRFEDLFYLFNHNWGQKIKIYVPDEVDEINAKITTGDFKINGFSLTKAQITTTTGEINLKNVTADNVKLKTTTGDVTLKYSTVETVNVQVTTGEIYFRSVEINTADLKATTGDIDIYYSNIDKLVSESKTGEFTFEDGKVRHLEVSTTTGDIELEIIGNKKLYEIRSYTGTGSNNARPQTVEGDKKLILRTTTGDIDLSWESI